MKLDKIINDLCSQDISKHEALDQITDIIEGFRNKGGIQCEVREVSFSVENNHGFIKLKLPYGYDRIKDSLSEGDRVDIILLP